MNVKRFTARTAREALAQVREALGEDAVVLSTKPSGDGVEVLALAPEGMARIQQAAAQVPVQRAAPPLLTAAGPALRQAAKPRASTLAERIAARGEHLAPEGMARIQQGAAQVPVKRAAPPLLTAAGPALRQAAKPRASTLAERIAARGERLDPRLEPHLEPRLDPRLDNRVEPRLEPTMTGALPFDASHSAVLPGGSVDYSVERDVEMLGMSTLTFQDYVRERMLKRRQAELAQPSSVVDALRPPPAARAAAVAPPQATPPLRMVGHEGRHDDRHEDRHDARYDDRRAEPARALPEALPMRHAALRERIANPPRREPPVLHDELHFTGPDQHDLLVDNAVNAANAANAGHAQRNEAMGELRGELRSVRALIEERFGMLAFMERLQRDPRQAGLSQQLFAAGLSPALVRKLVQSLPTDAPDELVWASGVLARNLHTDEHELPLEDLDGVFALIGPTGVGKTTSTAKLAAAFATKYGAANLGLITLDAYRVAAHEQLRTYGRILGVPVHTAHDRASLEDLLELLAGKKLVLIDTAGMAQRDARTRELLEMLQHPAIRKLLVINAAAQGETVEDVMVAYGVHQCHGVIVSKLDEAVKLGPALDALIRHGAKVVGVANGQRVPEDWHRLSAPSLVQRALRGGGSASWKLDASEVNLVFAAIHGAGYPGPVGAPQAAASHA